jgi:choline dehydrogenase-like flavoprotein
MRTEQIMEYDYVCRGRRVRGRVLATRLSQRVSVSVVLVEARPSDWALEIHGPAAFGSLFTWR